MCEYFLLFGRAPAAGESVAEITGKPSRKVAAVVGIAAAGHGNLVSRKDLRDTAHVQ
jgi:hypothetical protein